MTENLEDFDSWGEQFKAMSDIEEITLAGKYILSVQLKEDLHEQDMKYWDYHNYVIGKNSFNKKLFNIIEDLHSEQRGKDYNERESK